MINIKMHDNDTPSLAPKIAVIGVGGAGGNAVNNMISSGLEGCEFIVCNSDAQALGHSLCDTKIQLGTNVTGGLGAGSKPEVGKAAAEESLDDVMQYLEGANMAFVTAGMGGGTGTGAAPVIAKACRERGILTVGVVTKPFHFEGSHRMKSAEEGLREMQDYVDTLIVIPNQNLFRIANEKTTFADAFKMADSVLQSGVRGVTDLMVRPGLVNLDFADIRTAMLEMGKAMMGTGEADGEKRAIEAAEAAINNPLLDDVSMKGAHGVIINVTGGYDMTLFEADEAANRIRDEVDPDANIIFGATFDESMEGLMRVSIVATGIEKEAKRNTGNGGGSVRIDANSQATLQRAQPNTQGSAPATGGSSLGLRIQPQQTGPRSFAEQQGLRPTAPQNAPSQQQTSSFVPSSAASSQEPEQDMLDQVSYDFGGQGAESAPQNTALRGTRYKDSFIPPKPAQADKNVPEQQVSTQIPQQPNYQVPIYAQGNNPAYGPKVTAKPRPNAKLELKPPKAPQQRKEELHAERSKTPSLFERISGSVQKAVEDIKEEVQPNKSIRQQRVAPSPQQVGPLTGGPAQGSLNIDAPSKPKSGEEDLDIPAFLRRQAN
ncbi:MAG: cell division protein FtsZ [Pseudomonadota bacterium]